MSETKRLFGILILIGLVVSAITAPLAAQAANPGPDVVGCPTCPPGC